MQAALERFLKRGSLNILSDRGSSSWSGQHLCPVFLGSNPSWTHNNRGLARSLMVRSKINWVFTQLIFSSSKYEKCRAEQEQMTVRTITSSFSEPDAWLHISSCFARTAYTSPFAGPCTALLVVSKNMCAQQYHCVFHRYKCGYTFWHQELTLCFYR